MGNALLIDEVYSTEDSAGEIGTLHLINDHFNLSGRSPLFGINEVRWGVRFPDMSNLYDRFMREVLLNSLSLHSKNLKCSTLGFFVGPLFFSQADSLLCRGFQCSLIDTSMVPSVLVFRHQQTKVVCVGITTAVVNSNERKYVTVPSEISDSFSALYKSIPEFVKKL